MNQCQELAQNSASSATQTNEIFHTIHDKLGHINADITQIAAAADQQTQTLYSLEEQSSQIKSIADEVMQDTESAELQAKELKSLSDQSSHLMRAFKLEDSGH
ncbi:methyl-accepting chemotaxis protein [Ostreibacterium oceani]|uniref:Methyl-accepting chemotaxis protein n=1 Tax=Ostreibacterium oceani TaxID=2654998 RepID=A0A6N7EYB9_9GAMM|nr:methyl-accepting chemotaxis protein [Ostreibacterium oceani]MPV86379.1 hypothetical protein [Ostreibacterium oceani]